MAPAPDRSGQAVGALLLVQVLFGLFPVAAKKAFLDLDPWPILGLRVAGAAFFLMAIHLAFVRNPIPMRKLGWKVVGLAFLGVILNMSLFMFGIQRTTAVEAVLVITTIPVFTYAIAVLMGRETVGPRRIAGIVVAIAGVAVLTLRAGLQGGANWLGDIMVLLNALSYAAFLVFARPITQKYDPLSLVTWVFLIGAIVFLPLGLAFGLRGQLAAASDATMLWMVFIILGATVLTYVLNTVALRHVQSSTVAAFTYIQPVFTALAAWWLLGEKPEWQILPAAALVFVGVWLVARKSPPSIEGQVVAE